MKQEYKFLIDLCNNIKAPDDDIWWHTATGYGYITPKSDFVEHIITILTKKDKNFPEKEFLKQVQCKYRYNGLVDIVYKKQHELEQKKKEREERKEKIKAEKEREKYLEEFGWEFYD